MSTSSISQFCQQIPFCEGAKMLLTENPNLFATIGVIGITLIALRVLRAPSSAHGGDISRPADERTAPPADDRTARPAHVRRKEDLCVEFCRLEAFASDQLNAMPFAKSRALFATANAVENRARNRYSNIHPFESNRVIFEEGTYFNASWVLGRKAIACQGPLPIEIDEFWKMVDHSDVTTIVSIVNPVESGRAKCADFWNKRSISRDEPVLYEQDAGRDDAPKIIRRVLKSPKGKEVFQYHLQNWPDHGVVDPETLAQLVGIVQDREKESGGPILVHCSAGVGRTGTFLAAYQASQTRSTNILDIAKDLRSHENGRRGMIQTDEQYCLVHDTVRYLLS